MNADFWKDDVAPVVRRFTPPTREEVRLEAAEIGLSQHEAEKYYAYFCSNGWRVGRNPMKNWKMALNSWRLRWLEWNGFVNVPKPKVTLPSKLVPNPQGQPQSEAVLKLYAQKLNQLRKEL